jgi:hypothetical protein
VKGNEQLFNKGGVWIGPPPKSNPKLPQIHDAAVLPPAEFDHDKYPGTIDVRRVDLEQLSTECRIDQLGGANTKTACSRRYGLQYCVIVIAHDYILNTQGVSYDAIYRHERAHCNGWHHANETVSK